MEFLNLAVAGKGLPGKGARARGGKGEEEEEQEQRQKSTSKYEESQAREMSTEMCTIILKFYNLALCGLVIDCLLYMCVYTVLCIDILLMYYKICFNV